MSVSKLRPSVLEQELAQHAVEQNGNKPLSWNKVAWLLTLYRDIILDDVEKFQAEQPQVGWQAEEKVWEKE